MVAPPEVEQLLSASPPGAERVQGLLEAELGDLHQQERVRTATDVLWRHSKLGLHLSVVERDRVATWSAKRWPKCTAPARASALPLPEGEWN